MDNTAKNYRLLWLEPTVLLACLATIPLLIAASNHIMNTSFTIDFGLVEISWSATVDPPVVISYLSTSVPGMVSRALMVILAVYLVKTIVVLKKGVRPEHITQQQGVICTSFILSGAIIVLILLKFSPSYGIMAISLDWLTMIPISCIPTFVLSIAFMSVNEKRFKDVLEKARKQKGKKPVREQGIGKKD